MSEKKSKKHQLGHVEQTLSRVQEGVDKCDELYQLLRTTESIDIGNAVDLQNQTNYQEKLILELKDHISKLTKLRTDICEYLKTNDVKRDPHIMAKLEESKTAIESLMKQQRFMERATKQRSHGKGSTTKGYRDAVEANVVGSLDRWFETIQAQMEDNLADCEAILEQEKPSNKTRIIEEYKNYLDTKIGMIEQFADSFKDGLLDVDDIKIITDKTDEYLEKEITSGGDIDTLIEKINSNADLNDEIDELYDQLQEILDVKESHSKETKAQTVLNNISSKDSTPAVTSTLTNNSTKNNSALPVNVAKNNSVSSGLSSPRCTSENTSIISNSNNTSISLRSNSSYLNTNTNSNTDTQNNNISKNQHSNNNELQIQTQQPSSYKQQTTPTSLNGYNNTAYYINKNNLPVVIAQRASSTTSQQHSQISNNEVTGYNPVGLYSKQFKQPRTTTASVVASIKNKSDTIYEAQISPISPMYYTNSNVNDENLNKMMHTQQQNINSLKINLPLPQVSQYVKSNNNDLLLSNPNYSTNNNDYDQSNGTSFMNEGNSTKLNAANNETELTYPILYEIQQKRKLLKELQTVNDVDNVSMNRKKLEAIELIEKMRKANITNQDICNYNPKKIFEIANVFSNEKSFEEEKKNNLEELKEIIRNRFASINSDINIEVNNNNNNNNLLKDNSINEVKTKLDKNSILKINFKIPSDEVIYAPKEVFDILKDLNSENFSEETEFLKIKKFDECIKQLLSKSKYNQEKINKETDKKCSDYSSFTDGSLSLDSLDDDSEEKIKALQDYYSTYKAANPQSAENFLIRDLRTLENLYTFDEYIKMDDALIFNNDSRNYSYSSFIDNYNKIMNDTISYPYSTMEKSYEIDITTPTKTNSKDARILKAMKNLRDILAAHTSNY